VWLAATELTATLEIDEDDLALVTSTLPFHLLTAFFHTLIASSLCGAQFRDREMHASKQKQNMCGSRE
jgi:hypothetical protein